MSNIRVLLIGINYINDRYKLQGCINDVLLMKQYLKQYLNIPNINVTLMSDDVENNSDLSPSKKNILKYIEKCIEQVNNSENNYDTLWIHYS